MQFKLNWFVTDTMILRNGISSKNIYTVEIVESFIDKPKTVHKLNL